MTQPISVLLVDDNATFLRIAGRFLREYTGDAVDVVGVAEGGEEALELARDLDPQVVLLDLAMPDLPGLEAIPRLRETAPTTKIIVLTLMDTEGYRDAAMAAGADDFVAKATLSADLLPAIQRVMANCHDSPVGTVEDISPSER